MKQYFLGMIGCLAVSACAAEQPRSGEEIFHSYCTACHGASGMGDGPLAGDLAIAPADLTRLAAGNGGVFPMSRVMEKIYGYPGRYQSHIMPEFGPVLEGPRVMWTDENGKVIETPRALVDIAEYLKSIQRP